MSHDILVDNEVDPDDGMVVPEAVPQAIPEPPPRNELLHPHGTAWVEIDAVETDIYPDMFPDNSRLNWRGRTAVDGVKHREEYFYQMFPMSQIDSIVEGTNEALLGGERVRSVTSKYEIIKWIGIRATAALEKRRGSTRD